MFEKKRLLYLLSGMLFCCGLSGLWAQNVPAKAFEVAAVLLRDDGGRAVLELQFTIAADAYLYEDAMDLTLPEGLQAELVAGPEPVAKEGEESRVFLQSFNRRYLLTGNIDEPLEISVHYQGCSKGVCFMPETAAYALTFTGAPARLPAKPAELPTEERVLTWQRQADGFAVLGTATGYMDKDAFLGWLRRAEAGTAAEEQLLDRVLARYGLLVAALLIIPLGFMLNLTPCVLPMIPINLAIIGAGAAAGDKMGRGFLLGAMYGLGMTLVYGAIGVAVVLTGARFGAINSSPWFNFGVAVVFLLLALAMFDVLVVDFSRWRAGRFGSIEGGHAFGAFLLGALAAALAGACVAPVLIWVLLLAADLFARGNPVGLFLPFLLGIGMALPWPILGAGMGKLPKPGVWMERVKQVFGVLIIVAALYYGWLGVTLLRAGSGGASSATASVPAGWLSELPAAMSLAEAENKPLFLDFWGVSCKSCAAMKRTTFKEPEVIAHMEDWVKVAVQADDMSDPLLQAILKRYEVIGLPTYVLMRRE
ncbi:MAG: cytochrome c biogenesis protein CcdA [Lentisphaeria bacterium]